MARRLPPVWLMGFLANLPIGVFGALMLLTVPQLLAARHVPEPTIATLTAIGMTPSFLSTLVAPILDWRFNRRTYAMVFLALSAAFLFLMLLSLDNLPLLGLLMFCGWMTVYLAIAAFSGWLALLVPDEHKARLGAWYSIASISGFGVVAAIAITLLRQVSFLGGAAALSLLMLAPLALCFILPSIAPDGRLAHESFRMFFRDLGVLLRRREVLWTLALFLPPAASFALTNMLGGLGGVFGASEQLVALAGGGGVMVAGLVGSLLAPVLLKRAPPRRLYLLVGAIGALFTLALLLVRPSPATFVLAIAGENLFQATTFAIEYAIVLRGIGHDNPFAATQFALINAATSLPLTYMQMIDGQAYGRGGLKGALLADGGLALLACLLLALVFRLWGPREAAPVPA